MDDSQGRWRYGARARTGVQVTRVNRLRIARGLTQPQLATRAGVSVRTIIKLMAGAKCSVRVHAAVAHALSAEPLDIWPDLASDPDVLIHVPKSQEEDADDG